MAALALGGTWEEGPCARKVNLWPREQAAAGAPGPEPSSCCLGQGCAFPECFWGINGFNGEAGAAFYVCFNQEGNWHREANQREVAEPLLTHAALA